MARAIIVALNGVYQQINKDFITKGQSIVFKHPPTGTLDITAVTDNLTTAPMSSNMSSYPCTGKQTTFHLPAFPASKFAVITDHEESVPKGYTVVDVNAEIETWIRNNCPISDWKWADQLADPRVAGRFGIIRLIIKDSLLTFIATKWSE